MNSAMPLVYNPREESADVLEKMFVGRGDILKELEDDLRAQIKSRSRQHWLIRGPRGMGKTHLVAILYHRIHCTPELAAALLPVWLGEAETFDAYSAGMLLLAIANRLVDELKQESDAAASALRTSLDDITHGGDDPALFNDLCELLKNEANQRGKILVVLMENLDAWLEGISGQRGTVEAGRLRSLLSDDKEFLFISTTPTQYLPKLSRPGFPLFGHLRERKLQPMSEDNLRDLFQRLKTLTGREIAVEDDPHRPETKLRWRVLHRLAGGNPRAAVMAFSVISGAPGIQAMVGELARLLDAQTAYYEARLARLAPRERAIVRALALAPQNLTISQIAELSRLPERSLSTQVKRLLDEGHIAPAGDRHGKGSLFELTDGLFRTWHHYRSGRHMLEPLVRFLALWHTQPELESTLSALSAELAAPRSPLERDWRQSTALQIQSALEYARSPVGSAERERLWVECEWEVAAADSREVQKYLREMADPGRISDPEAARDCATRIIGAYRRTRQIASRDRPEAIAAVVDAATLLVTMGQLQDAGEALRDLRRFDERTESALRELVASAILYLGLTLGQAGRLDEAGATYRDVVARLGKGTESALRVQVSRAMVGLGLALGNAGRVEEEMAAYHDVVASFGESKEGALREPVASALLHLGLALGQAGRLDEAVAACRNLIAQFGDGTTPEIRMTVANAGTYLATSLFVLKQYEGAAQAASRAVDLCLLPPGDPGLLISVRLVLARSLHALGRHTEGRLALRDAAHQLTVGAHVPLPLAEGALRAILCRLPLLQVEELLREIESGAEPAIRETARLYGFVLSVLQAEEPAGDKVKLGPAARKRRALELVPPELRETVIEKATLIKRERSQK